jgi:hypothetical protein
MSSLLPVVGLIRLFLEVRRIGMPPCDDHAARTLIVVGEPDAAAP